MGKIRLLILSLLFFLSTTPVFGSTDSDIKVLGDIFEELGISMEGVTDFVIQKNILREGKENTFWTIVAENNERVIRFEIIKNIDLESAHRYIEERRRVIDSLYKRIPSPYPGMISKTIECPDKFKPKVEYIELDGEKIPVTLLSSTPRFTYGASVEELIKYRGALTFIYCQKENTLYRIELFVPKEVYERKTVLNILGSFTCKARSGSTQENPVGTKKDLGDFKNYNLTIIAFEPLGARHIGGYGYFRDTTPFLDKFSKDAFIFKNAVSPSSWTLPVFMSWFTSLYPSQHKLTNKYSTFTKEEKVLSNLSELSPSAITLAEVLKKNGYSTAGFTGDAGVEGTFGYSLGFDIYYDQTTFGGFGLTFPMALDWLREHKKERFFLFIQGYDVHGRYPLPDDFENKFADPNYKGKYKGTVEEYWELRNLNLDQEYLIMTDEDVRFWRDWYDGKIYEADRRLGEFLEEFEKLGLLDKTIIVITSGSGNEFYEHKGFDHGYSLYDELIHVPLIIKIPGKKGRVIENQVRTIDIMPTVLDILNIDYDEDIENQMQGVSLIPLMSGEDVKLDAFSETDYLFYAFKRSLRTNDGWKFIYSIDTEQKELYNLKEDAYELHNIAEEEKKVAYELEQRLFDWMQSMGQDEYYHKELMKDTFEIK